MVLPGVVASGHFAATALQSVRFDASTDKYSRSATGLGAVAFTRCCWVKIMVDRNAFSMALGSDNGGSGYHSLGFGTDGTGFGYISSAGDAWGGVNLPQMTVGVWYFIAEVHPVGAITIPTWYWQSEGQSTLSTFTAGGASSAAIADTWTIYIGNDGFGDFLNGSIAQVRYWTAALTSTELLAEYHATSPVRTSNLWAAYSFASGPQTTDDSGNGRTLTAAGTIVADTAGPSIT